MSLVYETFILYHKDKMSVKEMASHLKGVGIKTVQKFLDNHAEEVKKSTKNKKKSPNKKQHTATTKKSNEKKSPQLPTGDGRTTIMTEAASQHGDDVRQGVRSGFNPSRIFIPDPDKKSI